MKLLGLALAIVLLAGCASVTHVRKVVGPDGKLTAIETEKAKEFLSKGEVSKLKVLTKDGAYTHSVSADTANVAGDTEFTKAVIESTGKAVGEGIGAAAKTAVKP